MAKSSLIELGIVVAGVALLGFFARPAEIAEMHAGEPTAVASSTLALRPRIEQITVNGLRPGMTRAQIWAIKSRPGISCPTDDYYPSACLSYYGKGQAAIARSVVGGRVEIDGRPVPVARLLALLGPRDPRLSRKDRLCFTFEEGRGTWRLFILPALDDIYFFEMSRP